MDGGALAEGSDIDRADFLLFLSPSALGLGLFLGISGGSGSFTLLVSFLGFFGQVMWGFMTSDPFVFRSVVVMWILRDIGVAFTVFLFLVVVETVSGSNVLKTEDMLGPFRGEVSIWDKHALGMWSPLITSEI